MEKDETQPQEQQDVEIHDERVSADEAKGAEVPDLFQGESFTKDVLAAADIHGSLLLLFDNFMQNAGVTDPNTIATLARLRAQIDIALKGL